MLPGMEKAKDACRRYQIIERPLVPPKSLGELCLDEVVSYPAWVCGITNADGRFVAMPWAFAALRRILYHGDTASRIAAWAELDGPKWKGRPPQSYPVSGQKGHILGGNREEKP